MNNYITNGTEYISDSADQTEANLRAESKMKPPWNPSIFYALALLCGFGAAGILAGINYRRLGKPALRWPTIIISLVAFVGMVVGITLAGIGDNVALGYLVNIPVAVLLERVQRPLYKRYKETAVSVNGGGWGIPVAAGVGNIALLLFSAFICGFFLSAWSVYDADEIVAIQIDQRIVGNLDKHTDIDAYSFRATEGECYIIETTEHSTTDPLEDPCLTLWYSDGYTVLEYNDDYADSLQSCIEWTAQSTGTFYLTVESADLASTGDYVLSITCTSR